MPAYGHVKQQLQHPISVAHLKIFNFEIEILESILPGTLVPIWLISCPSLFDRKGNPYLQDSGEPWEDNAQRFNLFCYVIASIALNHAGLNWKPDILHCNDWHTGIACALLNDVEARPGILFTIHNLAYQGLFPHSTFLELQLPSKLWSYEGVEFNNLLSFIKAGIVYADRVNTVSPTYAKEIQTEEYGCGLDKLLQYYSDKLSGIINGVNAEEWNPKIDNKIYVNFTENTLKQKNKNKISLQKEIHLNIDDNLPLLSLISRLAEQKGIDLVIDVLSDIKNINAQVVILGNGKPSFESALKALAEKNPGKVSAIISYNEELAHKITAGADYFIMPSRFEPCGLNQMYSQHYGTIPIVRNTGGLADTVIDKFNNDSMDTQNTGIKFEKDDPKELLKAINRGLNIYADKETFKQMQLNGMQQNFSWERSALQYLDLYEQVIQN